MTEPPEEPSEVEASPVTTGDVARGSVWALASTVIPQVYTFATSVFIARMLGASGVGRVAFIAFVESTLVTVLVVGLPTAYMRFVGETMGRGAGGMLRHLSRSVGLIMAASAAVGGGILIAVAFFGGEPRAAWFFAALVCAGAIMHSFPSAFLIGVRRWRDATIIGMSTGALGVVAKVGGLIGGGGVTMLFAIDCIMVWLNVIGTAWLARRAAKALLPAAAPSGDLLRRVIRFALIGSIGLIVSLVLYRRTEILFLERYSTDQQIAIYSVPFSIVVSLIMLPRALIAVIAPTVATLFGEGDLGRIRSGYGRSLRVVLLFGFVATAGAVALGPAFVTLLYGAEFGSAGPVLVVLLVTVPFVPLMAIAQSVLLGIGKQWVPNAIIAVGAAANLSLDALLIPRFDAVGAAVANSLAQLLAAVPLVLYASHCVGRVRIVTSPTIRGLVAASLAATVAGTIAYVLPGELAVPLGAVVFAGLVIPLLVIFRALSADDARWLESAIGERRAIPVRRLVEGLSR